ncbi:hypothetical protein K7640_27905 [Micromonospora sp. PLK6-60]|uniref:hypothetical protein n=1 Tax=Micromonospora sp. PLK6-60 TaxID=2873383 RepID=UPI001CA68ACB|nr:hypothetical protein [Micromonospora sp. PLK6-60]MBY8875660.1 hypothetical protein [Micromonospora sp. PLK6-60]
MARHPLAPARTGAPTAHGRVPWTARRRLAPLLLLALLVPAACAGPTDTPAGDRDAAVDSDGGGDAPAAPPPACPFTAEQASELAGLALTDQGNCLFGDGRGVASLTITTASRLAGEATWDYQHEQAGKRYERVTDVDRGVRAYVAAKDIEGEAVMITEKGSYTVTMSSFSTDVAGYEQRLRRLLEAIPS